MGAGGVAVLVTEASVLVVFSVFFHFSAVREIYETETRVHLGSLRYR